MPIRPGSGCSAPLVVASCFSTQVNQTVLSRAVTTQLANRSPVVHQEARFCPQRLGGKSGAGRRAGTARDAQSHRSRAKSRALRHVFAHVLNAQTLRAAWWSQPESNRRPLEAIRPVNGMAAFASQAAEGALLSRPYSRSLLHHDSFMSRQRSPASARKRPRQARASQFPSSAVPGRGSPR